MKAQVQRFGLVAAAAAAVLGIGYTTHRAYPVHEWLLTRVAGYWALSLYWGAGCLAVGSELVNRLLPRRFRPAEVASIGFALGVVAFAVSVFVAGLAGVLGLPFFVAAPAAFIAAGLPSLRALGRRAAVAVRGPFSPSAIELAALVLGALGLVATYLPILTPHNIQHDARWYHLPIAAQYVSMGKITRFPEGWFLGAYPHLSSLLYAWGLLLPARIVHRLLLCAHLEFVVVVATLLAVPVVLRRVLPGTRLPVAWAGVFLFPSFLAYDSNVSLGADHIAALFAPALLLALYPALRTLRARDAALVGALAGGAALTKYSAICLVAPALGAVLVRAYYVRRSKAHAPRATNAVYAAAAAFAVVWSPHWLANYFWYGDPLYPHLHAYFRGRPWDVQAEIYLRVFLEYAVLRPTRDLSGIFETVLAAATLGFRVNEPFGFRGDLPLFGFLFAATLYCVPFLRAGRRHLVVEALAVAAVCVWYWTNHRDRYLQACLPWLVVATVAVLATIWKRNDLPARAAVVLLVGAEALLGAGIFLVPLHVMVPGHHPLPEVIELVKAGYEKRYSERFEPFPEWNFADWVALGKQVPRGARVLVHEDRLWLGFDAPVVVDEAQWQAGIRYFDRVGAGGVYEELAPYGVSYVVTGQSHGDGGGHGVSGDLAFWNFLTTSTTRVATSGKLTLWKMPGARPSDDEPGPALILTCNQSIVPGLYALSALTRGQPTTTVPPGAAPPVDVLDRAEFLVLEKKCPSGLDDAALQGFAKMADRRGVSYFRRKDR